MRAKIKELMEEATKAYENSYAPYSGIRIGAAVVGGSGKVYTGVNIENSSYGATICAERSAVSKAVTDGETEIEAIAITGDFDGYAYPCGICRQVLAEFMKPDAIVAVSGVDKEIKVYGLSELLPDSFLLREDKGGRNGD